jgi:hypothetical protein
MRWTDDDWSDRLRVLELAVRVGVGMRERILVALRFASKRARTAEKRGLRLQLPDDHPAVTIARCLGAVQRQHYGWQMKVLDPVGFMLAIKSVLEARLAESFLAGFDGSLLFDFYRSSLALSFRDGTLGKVIATTRGSSADARMRFKQATQLWLGWRGREALEAWYPDFWTREPACQLLDVLFPKARAYIHLPY